MLYGIGSNIYEYNIVGTLDLFDLKRYITLFIRSNLKLLISKLSNNYINYIYLYILKDGSVVTV